MGIARITGSMVQCGIDMNVVTMHTVEQLYVFLNLNLNQYNFKSIQEINVVFSSQVYSY